MRKPLWLISVILMLALVTALPTTLTNAAAQFKVTDLSISPTFITAGSGDGSITIIVKVDNTNSQAGTYKAELKINDVVETTKDVALDAGQQGKDVQFSVTKKDVGEYNVSIETLKGVFSIAPAALEIKNLLIDPLEVSPGKEVVISVIAQNKSADQPLTYDSLKLLINGNVVDKKRIELKAGDSATVSFKVTRSETGNFVVNLGPKTGAFSIKASIFDSFTKDPLNIIIGVVVLIIAIMIVLLFATPKKKKGKLAGGPGKASKAPRGAMPVPGQQGQPYPLASGQMPPFPGQQQQVPPQGIPPYQGQAQQQMPPRTMPSFPGQQQQMPQYPGQAQQMPPQAVPPYQGQNQQQMPPRTMPSFPGQQQQMPQYPGQAQQMPPQAVPPYQGQNQQQMPPRTMPSFPGQQQMPPRTMSSFPGQQQMPPQGMPPHQQGQAQQQMPPRTMSSFPGQPQQQMPPSKPNQFGALPAFTPAAQPGFNPPAFGMPGRHIPQFTVNNLTITPQQLKEGDPVNVSAIVTNNTTTTGQYSMVLRIGGVVENISELTLNPGTSQTGLFTIIKDTPGDYYVEVDGQRGMFTVIHRLPAAFSISNLTIAPDRVKQGEPITIGAIVTNSGETAGSYSVVLRIKGIAENIEEIALEPGRSQKVVFTITKDTAGFYPVALENLNGKFVVEMDWKG